jgi:NADH dehydrogenase
MHNPANYHVTVFGGTGFLGHNLVDRLLRRGYRVRVAVRNPRQDMFQDVDNRLEQVQSDVCNAQSVADAIKDSDGVVNAVGLYVESQSATFEGVHVLGAQYIAQQSVTSGAKLVHISGIGTDTESPSTYIRARAVGEQRVREAAPQAVILRPSVLFGRNDAFLRTLSGLVNMLPVIPLFGNGSTRLQPVYVKDVAKAIECVLCSNDLEANIYELGGAQILTYKDLLSTIARHLNRKRLMLPIPFVIWELLAALASVLPNPPLTRDQIELMRHDNIVALDSAGFAELGIEQCGLEDLLSMCLNQKS